MRSLDFVIYCYEDRMFRDKSTEQIEASLDKIRVIDTIILELEISKDKINEDTEFSKNSNHYVNSKFTLFTIVINALIFLSLAIEFRSGISKKITNKFIKSDMLVVCCKVGTKEFIKNIIDRFIGQATC